MSTPNSTITADQRDQIQTFWDNGLSEYVQSYLKGSVFAHWWRNVESYKEDPNEDNFEKLSVQISEDKGVESEASQDTAPSLDYWGIIELRGIGLVDSTHVTIAIATSWVIGSRKGLEDRIASMLREADIPDHFVKIGWYRCDPIAMSVYSDEITSV